MTLDSSTSVQTENPNNGGLRGLLNSNPQLAQGLGAAIIVVATLLTYVQAMRSDFIWDDDYYVTNNPLLRNWEGLQRIWFDVLPRPSEYALPQYYPMTHTSFWIEYRLWGFNPTGYHVTNVLLHACNALLVWLILRKLNVPGAFVAAVIFALHPINVESVAWIAERKNVLSLMFFLASLYVYLRYAGVIPGKPRVEKPAPDPDNPEQPAQQIEWFTLPDDPQRLYALAAVLFLFALFSKTVASSMPVVALLIIWWKRGGRIDFKKDVVPLLPMVAVGIGMGMLTAYMEKVRVGVAMRPQDWIYAATPLGQFAARCIIAGRAFWFYIGKLFLPYPLMFNYPRWDIDPANPVQYACPLGAVALIAALWLARKRIGLAPFAAIVYYTVTLFPALGFVNVWPMRYSFVADHFVYVSAIGIIALVAAVLARLLALEALSGLTTVAALLCMAVSFSHERLFKDQETLWKTTWTQSHFKSWMAANNYGSLLMKRPARDVNERLRFLDGAENSFNLVLKLKPDHPEARLNLGKIYLARADIDTMLARAAAATQSSSQPAIAAATTVPTTQVAGDYERAIAYFEDAIRVQPNFVDAYMELGHLLRTLGRDDEATDKFKKALEIYPRNEAAHEELGALALKYGRHNEAVDHFLHAVEIAPESPQAHSALGTALLRSGDLAHGLPEWEEAMRLAPDDPDLPNSFGAQMADAGEYAKAVDYLKRAYQIDPNNVMVLTNYGVVAVKAGYPDKAKDWFERALQIDPNFAIARHDLEELKAGRLRPATTRASTTAPSAKPQTQPQ